MTSSSKAFRFAEEHPVGSVLPCVVHSMRRREDGSAAYREILVNVEIVGFRYGLGLAKVRRVDTAERLDVDLGWFKEANRIKPRLI